MRTWAIAWAAALGLLTAGVFVWTGSSRADIEPANAAALAKIAAALENGKDDDAKKMAAALAKKIDELNDVMHGFKPRPKGVGVGHKAGVVVPDGLELKYNSIGRDGITPQQLGKEGQNLVEGAWMTAAIMEVALAKTPAKDMGKKKRAKWIEWTEGTRDGARELAKAAKAMSTTEVKTAVVKMNNNCNSCHMIFR
jgi:hypothetical protein